MPPEVQQADVQSRNPTLTQPPKEEESNRAMNDTLTRRTLLLATDASPLALVPWQTAILRASRPGHTILAEHISDPIKTPRMDVPRPSIMMTNSKINLYTPAPFTRENAVIAYSKLEQHTRRPTWKCALCGHDLQRNAATFDHIIPQSKGGKTSWDNIVLTHASCNNAKGDKSLRESGFSLQVSLMSPTNAYLNRKRILMNTANMQIPTHWDEFLTITS